MTRQDMGKLSLLNVLNQQGCIIFRKSLENEIRLTMANLVTYYTLS